MAPGAQDALHDAFPEWQHGALEDTLLKLVVLSESHRGQDAAATAAESELLDVVEGWSGAGAISRSCIEQGLRVKSFDKKYLRAHNLHSPRGLRLWLLTVSYLRSGGTMWMAPTCASWVWISRSRTRRSAANPLGVATVPAVQDGNASVSRVIILAVLRERVGVKTVIEQPLSSLMDKVPAFTRLMERAAYSTVTTFLGAFGATSLKPTKFYSGAPWVGNLKRKKVATAAVQQLAKRTKDARTGKVQVTGLKTSLSASENYPIGLGRAVAKELA